MKKAARAPGGLVWVDDRQPGIARLRRRGRFVYRLPDGRPLRDAPTLRRIAALAIPPAYTEVWICARPEGHLQATGRDARGRKQYRYHPDWRIARDEQKFHRLLAFGQALPAMRQRIERDLRPAGGPLARETILAALARLLDTTFLRVGNAEYARANGSFGLTTLLNQHARASGSRLLLRFQGKSGVAHSVALDDPRVARIVRRCQQLRGQALFQYEDEQGELRGIGSADVNDYLNESPNEEPREAAGTNERFTAKDFRTWHASVLALDLALRLPRPCSPRVLLAPVARQLGNTVAVCRKAYVHPAILEWAAAPPEQHAALERRLRRLRGSGGLGAAERRLLAFLADAGRG